MSALTSTPTPQPGGWTNNSALFIGLDVDAEKLVGWRGASFGFQFLQFNGADTNADAGSIAGYNGIVGLPPFNRYIPTPGVSPNTPGALATTMRLTVLF
jgi:carbohydrate-selective porin OprB